MISNECNGCEYQCNLSHIDICTLGSPCPHQRSTPMTEQEYLQTCDTEQLAKVLLSFCQYPCEICKIECDGGNACTYNKALNTIVEWLKQPHGGES